jgi:hypothetical protein
MVAKDHKGLKAIEDFSEFAVPQARKVPQARRGRTVITDLKETLALQADHRE